MKLVATFLLNLEVLSPLFQCEVLKTPNDPNGPWKILNWDIRQWSYKHTMHHKWKRRPTGPPWNTTSRDSRMTAIPGVFERRREGSMEMRTYICILITWQTSYNISTFHVGKYTIHAWYVLYRLIPMAITYYNDYCSLYYALLYRASCYSVIHAILSCHIFIQLL